MDWKEISAEEAEKHPAYGFGGGLYVVYAIVILWSLHSLYIVFLDSGYKLTQSYGYENFTMADFTCFIQFILALPFLYLAPKLHPTMPSVSSVAIFGELGDLVYIWHDHSESHTDVRLGERRYAGELLYLLSSARVNVTYRNRVKATADLAFGLLLSRCDLTVSHLFLRWRFKTSAKAVPSRAASAFNISSCSLTACDQRSLDMFAT